MLVELRASGARVGVHFASITLDLLLATHGTGRDRTGFERRLGAVEPVVAVFLGRVCGRSLHGEIIAGGAD